MTSRRLLAGIAPLFLSPIFLAGCESEPRNVAAKAATTPPAAPKPDNFIVGKTTSDVRNADVEKQKGGQVASQQIVAKDPFTLAGNTYITAISQNSINNMKHAVDLYRAETGEYPKTYEEFMEKIVTPNNAAIRLPVLPHYQKYVYDEKEHTLKIMEYPALRNQPPK